MKQRVAELPPHSAVLYAVLVLDAAGILRPMTRGLQDIHDAANAPVFGVFASNVDRGVVGGRLVSDQESWSQRRMVLRIRVLHGESPGAIKTPPLSPGTPVYNWKELRRWGISEASLPFGQRGAIPRTNGRGAIPMVPCGGCHDRAAARARSIAGLVSQRLRRRRAERETGLVERKTIDGARERATQSRRVSCMTMSRNGWRRWQ